MNLKKSVESLGSRLRLWPARHSLVRQFGKAKLIRRPNGQHELIGGTDTDRANAFEWSSLFAHEIVFTHFHREDRARSRPQKAWLTLQLEQAL